MVASYSDHIDSTPIANSTPTAGLLYPRLVHFPALYFSYYFVDKLVLVHVELIQNDDFVEQSPPHHPYCLLHYHYFGVNLLLVLPPLYVNRAECYN